MKQAPVVTKDQATDAADVLNDFLHDFITGVMVFHEYDQHHKTGKLPLENMVGVQRMCVSHIVLACAKFEEFWKRYHHVVPEKHKAACRSVLKQIQDRGIADFRNQIVGHIWNPSERRPLRHSEVMRALERMMAPGIEDFLNWVNNPRWNVYPNTIASIVEAVRDAIVEAYGLEHQQIIGR